MPIAIKMKMKGLKELERNLIALGEEFNVKNALQALRPAFRKALKPLVSQIQSSTPVDSGALRASVKLRIKRPKAKQKQSGTFNKNTVLEGSVGWFWSKPSLWKRALTVEYGNKNRPAQSVLRNALESNADQMLSTFKSELKIAIEKKRKQLYKKRRG